MKALYCAIDALLWAVAFTPIAIYRQLEELQQAIRDAIQRRQYRTKDNTGQEVQKTVQIWDAFKILDVILVMPLWLLYRYVTAKEFFEDTEEGKAIKRRRALHGLDGYKDSIEKWMEAADHHDTTSPDIMAALTHFEAYVKDEIHSSQSEMLSGDG